MKFSFFLAISAPLQGNYALLELVVVNLPIQEFNYRYIRLINAPEKYSSNETAISMRKRWDLPMKSYSMRSIRSRVVFFLLHSLTFSKRTKNRFLWMPSECFYHASSKQLISALNEYIFHILFYPLREE